MRHLFQDKEHLVRLVLLLVLAVAGFLVVKSFFVPKGFGAYGHYRPGALADNSSRPLQFAGRAACAECHQDMADTLSTGKHHEVGCEACHGPLGGHAADPTGVAAVKPDPTTLCATCHAARVGRPQTFPQVDVEDHAGGLSCTDCHAPHHPGQTEGKS